MLYFTGKITFNLAEMSGDILRGVLILPIIKNRRNIHFTVAIREINSQLTVFKPVYITHPGQKSVDQCHRELDTYFCSEADLQPIQMTRLDAPILYADGMVLLNAGTRAEIKDKKNNDTLKTVRGPAICTTEETSTVIYGDRVLYTKTSAFHVKHETVEFDVDPFPITLELPAYTPLRFDRETAIEPTSFRWQGSYIVILGIAVIVILFFLYRCIEARKVAVEKVQSQPLQEILVLTQDSRPGKEEALNE